MKYLCLNLSKLDVIMMSLLLNLDTLFYLQQVYSNYLHHHAELQINPQKSFSASLGCQKKSFLKVFFFQFIFKVKFLVIASNFT